MWTLRSSFEDSERQASRQSGATAAPLAPWPGLTLLLDSPYPYWIAACMHPIDNSVITGTTQSQEEVVDVGIGDFFVSLSRCSMFAGRSVHCLIK